MLCFLFLTLLLFACSSNKGNVKESPFDPDASLNEANELIEKGRYEQAREVLETIRTRDASQQYAVLARVRIADTYFEDESYEEAAVEYESFLSQYPYHRYASYAQYKLAMSFFRRIKTVDVSYSVTKRALAEFQRLQRQYPRNPYMEVTESRINMCRRLLAEYEFYVGSFYFKKGAYLAAARRFDGLLRNFPNAGIESETLYYLGVSYENLGERDKAIAALTKLIEKYPTTERSREAQELIASFAEAP